MSNHYLTARRLDALAAGLQPIDWAVLELVGRLDFVTSRHVERVCFTDRTPLARARASRRTIRRLVSLGVLHELGRRVGGVGGGSALNVFTLDRAGQRLLTQADAHRPRARRPETRGLAFLAHALSVSDHYATLVELLSGLPDAELLTWLGEPDGHRSFTAAGRSLRLTPDAFVEVRRGGEVVASFLEVDRGTEALTTLQRKASLYLRYARLHPNETPQVVFSFSAARRGLLFTESVSAPARREGVPLDVARRLIQAATVPRAIRALAGEEPAAGAPDRPPPPSAASDAVARP